MKPIQYFLFSYLDTYKKKSYSSLHPTMNFQLMMVFKLNDVLILFNVMEIVVICIFSLNG